MKDISDIIKVAFGDIPELNKENVKKLCNSLEIKHTEEQIELCKYGIENGKWEGYSENLTIRKQRLKDLQEELERLKNEL